MIKEIKSEGDIVHDLYTRERELNIYDHRVVGVSLWRIIRFRYRAAYLNMEIGFQHDSTIKKVEVFSLLQDFFLSMIQLLSLLFRRDYKNKTLVFAFPRLQKVGDEYIDKFTDPVIKHTNIKNNNYIFQRSLAGKQNKSRKKIKGLIITDFIEILARVFSFTILPFVYCFHFREINSLYSKSLVFSNTILMNKFTIAHSASLFLCNYYMYLFLFRLIRPGKVFVVNREIFFPVIAVCKKLNIRIFELQHGITLGKTPLYTGAYDESIDPDFFLTFGSFWKAPQFGMEKERIINIGWAYRRWISDHIDGLPEHENTTLVISAPHITKKIVDAIIYLAENCIEHEFHLRLHPQERLNEEEIRLLGQYQNIMIVDNTIESMIAISSYRYILGENSSVLFEGASLGKRVGVICFAGLKSESISISEQNLFDYIYNFNDFNAFITSPVEPVTSNNIYSPFMPEKINSLLDS